MKILGLFRHAKSEWPKTDAGAPRARDFDRPLNDRGRAGAVVMGRHVRDHGVRWDRVLASPAIRCAETIELACEAAGLPVAVNWDRRIYLASSATLADVLREQDANHGASPQSLLMVGHNPGLEDLIFDLVPDNGTSPLREIVEIKFPTAAFAVLKLSIDSWAELNDRCGVLEHLVRPRDLDAALGPSAD